MSRYLTLAEIELITIKSKAEVEKFKLQLDEFLKSPPHRAGKECFKIAPALNNLNSKTMPEGKKSAHKKQ